MKITLRFSNGITQKQTAFTPLSAADNLDKMKLIFTNSQFLNSLGAQNISLIMLDSSSVRDRAALNLVSVCFGLVCSPSVVREVADLRKATLRVPGLEQGCVRALVVAHVGALVVSVASSVAAWLLEDPLGDRLPENPLDDRLLEDPLDDRLPLNLHNFDGLLLDLHVLHLLSFSSGSLLGFESQ